MHPTLFTVGPLSLQTESVFWAIAFLVSGFVFWKRGRAEHYPEDQLFDGFLLSTIVALLVGRIGFVALHFSQASIWQWLNPVGQAGVSGVLFLVAAGWYIYRYAQQNKWDIFEVLDLWSMSMTMGLAIGQLGAFFAGTGVGYATTLPWGIRFPGLIEAAHPIQLYLFVWYLLLFWYLSWAEYKYRTFSWYRGSKKTAQTGYLISVFIIAAAGFTFAMTFLRPATTLLFQVNVERLWSSMLVVAGFALLYSRSGRVIPLTREWLKQRKRMERLRR